MFPCLGAHFHPEFWITFSILIFTINIYLVPHFESVSVTSAHGSCQMRTKL